MPRGPFLSSVELGKPTWMEKLQMRSLHLQHCFAVPFSGFSSISITLYY